MLIELRDDKRKLVIKDLLDIDFDMSVGREENRFYVNINPNYKLNEEFIFETDAEERMIYIAECRNNLEEELRNY